MRRATVHMPGTCGEYVQGMLNGHHFLVSCTVDLFSEVTVELRGDGRIVAPRDTPKAEAALRAALRYLGIHNQGAALRIVSPLPRGKGMGSSTADVAGTIYAVALVAGKTITAPEVARLALSIEPTNSSLFANLALFDHRMGTQYQELGQPLLADILIVDCGGEVDTLAYNAVDRGEALREIEPLIAQSLALVMAGIRAGDLRLVGEGSTISALAHQRVLPKPELPAVVAVGKELGAAGVVVGHSGTVIGLVFGRGSRHRADIVERVARELDGLSILGWCSTRGGGIRESTRFAVGSEARSRKRMAELGSND